MPLPAIHPGFQRGQAEGLEHVLPAAQAGVLGLDGGLDRLALGLGQPLPGGAEPLLAGLVVLGLRLVAGAALLLLALASAEAALAFPAALASIART